MMTIPERGVVRSREPLKFWLTQPYLWNGCSYSRQILYTGYIRSQHMDDK